MAPKRGGKERNAPPDPGADEAPVLAELSRIEASSRRGVADARKGSALAGTRLEDVLRDGTARN